MGQGTSKKRRDDYGENDLEALEDGGWLTDHNMDVYYDYLEQEILARSDTWAQKVLLVRATIAYLIRHSTGDINGALDRLMVDPGSLASALPSDLRNRTYIFFPINDNDDPTAGHGGSHWSLLVVNRGVRMGLHYDSLESRNERVAKETLHKISLLLQEPLEFVPQPCPQQENVYDCGIHSLYNTRVLIQRLMHPSYRPARPWDLSDIEPNTTQNRADLRELFQRKWVERIAANAERQELVEAS